jgi:hypothetical protein
MAFTRHGTPEPIKLVTVCEDCKQDKPLMRTTKDGVTKQLCAECIKKWVNHSNDTAQ